MKGTFTNKPKSKVKYMLVQVCQCEATLVYPVGKKFIWCSTTAPHSGDT